ncbi:MAG: SHOCT domain-containing protein [Anaerolineae bacterium]|nr:SHOCT domain-containing protein [Anaerolineae bacterium]MCB0182176.1 SHOCT domain-containing protein [Anaerolineae bacterium]MCB9106372.1 SHOCT domain-containing protein [Anaerolineales bacterium]
MRRRLGHPLLRAAAVGGAGYYAGRRIAQGQQAEDMQNEQIADLQDQVASQQEQTYAPPPQETYAPPPPPAPAPAAAPGAGSDMVARLQELASLHASGVLTDDEFAAAKQKVLAGE